MLAVTELVRDINLTPDESSSFNSSYPGGFTELDGQVYFVASDTQHGAELWKTDGTAAGTALVKDINPGLMTSDIRNLVSHQGQLFFQANDGAHGSELWRSDGTTAGTVIVRDLAPSAQSSYPQNLTPVGSKLFFVGQIDFKAYLFVTDGTASGVTQIEVNGLVPFNGIGRLTDVGGTLFFSVSKDTGLELWTSDGTQAGTVRVKSIAQPTYVNGFEPGMVELNGLAYFFAGDDFHGSAPGQLWKSDGTAAGTVAVADVIGYELSVVGDRLYFRGKDSIHGIELWTSDGTSAGTHQVKDILPGIDSSNPRGLVAVGDEVYFVAQKTLQLAQLWKTDGTEPGTTLLSDVPVIVQANAYEGKDDPLAVVGDEVFFVSYDSEGTRALWKTDGTVGGTVPVTVLLPGDSSNFYGVSHLTEFAGQLIFAAFDQKHGIEPWKSDGTAAGTKMIRDVNPYPSGTHGIGSSYDNGARRTVASGGLVFVLADDGIHGEELWRTDATFEGTVLVRDLLPGPQSSNISYLTAIPGGVVFVANDGSSERSLWRSDGTSDGTVRLMDFDNAGYPYEPAEFAFLNGRLYFTLDSPTTGPAVWISDGTAAGTQQLASFSKPNRYATPHEFTALGEMVLFGAADDEHGYELWSTDGTSAGTHLVTDVTSGPAGYIVDLTRVGDEVFFFSDSTEPDLRGLWKTDGTAGGTTLIVLNNYGISQPVASEDLLFYSAVDPITFANYIWRTDGTAVGTYELRKEVHEPSMGVVNGMLYVEDSGILWRSDGTISGTIDLREFGGIDDDYNGGQFQEFDGKVYFKGDDGIHGEELWRTDGTPEGTELVVDLKPGRRGSIPAGILNFSGKLLMRADDGVHGAELYSFDPATYGVVDRHIFYNRSAFDGDDPVANASDDSAIAPDKFALPAGENGIFVNYTTYDRGINGVMVDIDSVEETLGAADFEFRVGRDDTPTDWVLAPAPLEISVRPGSGTGHSGRVTIIWPDGSILNQWLEITVKATAATGLAEPDVFYFGSAVGDTLNHPFNTIVNAMDEIGIRNHPTDSAAINDQYDMNRDGVVDAADEMIARANTNSFGTSVPLIRPQVAPPPPPLASATMLADLSTFDLGSSPAGFVAIGDNTLFFANDGRHGKELWKSDGTPGGTVMVRDIVPGPESSIQVYAKWLVAIGPTAYFVANDGIHGEELWRTDGTESGTALVKDLRPGSLGVFDSGGPMAGHVAVLGDELFFAIGNGVWKSDGTEAGTLLVSATSARDVVSSGGKIYFIGDGERVFATDGTSLELLKYIPKASALVDVNGTLFFLGMSQDQRYDLWKTAGTAETTLLVKDLTPLMESFYITMIAVDDTLFFIERSLAGSRLWGSDGTDAGTQVLLGPTTGRSEFQFDRLGGLNGKLYFSPYAPDLVSGTWTSDGTVAGTVQLSDVYAVSPPVQLGESVYFTGRSADPATFSWGLWKTNGTTAETLQIQSLEYTGYELLKVGGQLFFASVEDDSLELFTSDGTTAGTALLRDINDTSYPSLPSKAIDIDGTAYFWGLTGGDDFARDTLFKSDGTTEGTVALFRSTYYPLNPFLSNGRLYFEDRVSYSEARLMVVVNGVVQEAAEQVAYPTIEVGPVSYFIKRDELWKTDGTETGTVLVRSFYSMTDGLYFGEMTNFNGTLFFMAAGDSYSYELRKSDGTEAGTVLVKDISPTGSSYPEQLTPTDSYLFFTADDGEHGRELWRTDGTESGTILLKDIDLEPTPWYNGARDPKNLTAVDGLLFFTIDSGDEAIGAQLWRSDGTPGGTFQADDVFPAGQPNRAVSNLVSTDGQLFFTVKDDAGGIRLWQSDGTSRSARVVGQIGPAGADIDPADFSFAAGKLFFSADDGVHGREPWIIDVLGRAAAAGQSALAHASDEDWLVNGSVPGEQFTLLDDELVALIAGDLTCSVS